MSLSEQFASTPRDRLLHAAAAVLRAAGWTCTPPSGCAELVPDAGGNYRLQWRPRRELPEPDPQP